MQLETCTRVFREPNDGCFVLVFSHFCKISVLFYKLLCRLLNLVLIVLFLINFLFKKHYFLTYLFFVSAFQLEGLCIPMCGIQFYHCVSHTLNLVLPWNGFLLSNFICSWYPSSSAGCEESGKA